ncbi:DUF4328 domain-containing protein [Aquimarina sp. 2201CG1-2-11]|uniref:DUF4328 domain-containing protein n=1 Tax=Aquimarina discodermiae TaxID=3231043 RepID=UPI003463755E
MEKGKRIALGEKKNTIEIWDNSKRVKILFSVFWVLIVCTIIGIVSGYLELQLLKRAQLEFFIDEGEAHSNDLRQKIIGLLQTVIFIVSVIVFLNWFRRAYGNLHRLGISYLEYKESMALWAWFIPIIVLFRPVKIMNEIWKETQWYIKKTDNTYKIEKSSVVIGIWWGFFIVSNFVGRYVLKNAFKQDTLEQLIEGSQAFLIADIIQIPEALLVILIVHRSSKIESKLAHEIKKNRRYSCL